MSAGAGTQTQPRVQSSLHKFLFLTLYRLACRPVGEINETDLNHYNLNGKNLATQGYKITMIIISLLIIINTIILPLYEPVY